MSGQSLDGQNLAERLKDLESRLAALEKKGRGGPENRMAMVVFSGDLDRVMAALIMATGAAAMGLEVDMFFTFWGTPMLRSPSRKPGPKNFMGKVFGLMLPKGAAKAKLSKLHVAGMGTAMLKSLMKRKRVASLPELLDLAAEMEVRITICEMSMDLMGFTREEMIDYPHLSYGGVAAFVAQAAKSKVQLFL